MKKLLICVTALLGFSVPALAGGSSHHNTTIVNNYVTIESPPGPQGPVGPVGPAGASAESQGWKAGLGGGFRFQAGKFDIDTFAFDDVRHGGGPTAMGLLMIRVGESASDREIKSLRREMESLRLLISQPQESATAEPVKFQGDR